MFLIAQGLFSCMDFEWVKWYSYYYGTSRMQCCCNFRWVSSVSNGSVFGPFVLYWFQENLAPDSSVRVCVRRFPQLSPAIFMRKFIVWYMKYVASEHASFGCLRCLISSKLSKVLWIYGHFWATACWDLKISKIGDSQKMRCAELRIVHTKH